MYNHLSLPASLVCLMICMDPIPTHASSFSLLTFGTKKSAQVSVQRQPVYANATVPDAFARSLIKTAKRFKNT